MYDMDITVKIEDLGKMYKLYKNPKDKIKDAFGLNFYKKNYYKEFWALRDINICIRKGERVGFIGHNGAGKSTLLKIITGNIQSTEGKVEVNGKIQALLEMGTGFHPEFTGRENIRASLAYQGLKTKEILKIEEEIIEFTELGEYIDQPVRTYSAGMYSRLAFATASSIRPELLIIDEVLGAGDAYFNSKCVERMKRLTSKKETTVLFVSHDLQSVQALCDRVIWIDRGVIRYDGEVIQGVKLYADSVRRNEELRLKIRDMKISQKQALVLERKHDLYEPYLFRLVSDSPLDIALCKIYKISILVDNEEVCCINVGSAMDNDPEAEAYIIDEFGSTCWGKVKKNKYGYYREYNNALGKDKNAPFQMMISKGYIAKEIKLKLWLELETKEKITLQLFDQEKMDYFTCATLSGNNKEYLVDIVTREKRLIGNEKVKDYSNTEKVQIKNIKIIDRQGKEGSVIPFECNILCFEFDIHFKKPYKHFFIGFSIYSLNGEIALTSCEEYNLSVNMEEIHFQYTPQNCRFGSGEYYLSLGVYDEFDSLDSAREQSFLALIDRGISFKIEKAMNYNFGLGSILPDIAIEMPYDIDKSIMHRSLL